MIVKIDFSGEASWNQGGAGPPLQEEGGETWGLAVCCLLCSIWIA